MTHKWKFKSLKEFKNRCRRWKTRVYYLGECWKKNLKYESKVESSKNPKTKGNKWKEKCYDEGARNIFLMNVLRQVETLIDIKNQL
jgi:hypothetical protein